MSYFKPDFHLPHFSHITSEWLKENSIKTIFSDLDSTLAAHGKLGNGEVKNWVEMLKENGVQLIIISNNSQGRVDRFTKNYDIIGFGKCGKPATKKIKNHMEKVGATVETSLFLGDQLFTDIWCGKRLNMKTALVQPIAPEQEPINIRVKRVIETMVKKRWK